MFQSLIHTDPHKASIFSRLIPPPAGSHNPQCGAATPPVGNPLLSALSIENLFGPRKKRILVGRPLCSDVRAHNLAFLLLLFFYFNS